MQPNLESHELAVELMRSSRLDDNALRAGPRPVAHPLLERRRYEDARVTLGSVASDGLGIDAVLRARTSIRYYGSSALATCKLAAVLRAVGMLDAALYPNETQAGLGLELLVAAWRVDSVTPAFYMSVDDGAALARVGDLPTGEHATQLVLQREFADAPALVLVLGNLTAAEARHGAHGHRLLLQRAGVAAHAGWLTAIAQGLQGSVFAGLLPDKLRTLAGVDGSQRAQLLALSIGHPSSAGTTVNES